MTRRWLAAFGISVAAAAGASAQERPAATNEAPGAAPQGYFIVCPGHPRCRRQPRLGIGGGGGGGGGIVDRFGPDPRQYSFAFPQFDGGGGDSNSRSISFAPGAFSLDEAARAELDSLVPLLVSVPSAAVSVEGHPDEGGAREENVRLAGRRAEAVAAYLAARGIGADRIIAIAWAGDEAGATADEAFLRRQRAVVVTLGE